mmetsp:Transcript_87649/g.246205  ORF Transcript_87649/g.246205 Transcript_87649/m.246205 type:complete len:233 (-) Transcript_87649:65-763(-)
MGRLPGYRRTRRFWPGAGAAERRSATSTLAVAACVAIAAVAALSPLMTSVLDAAASAPSFSTPPSRVHSAGRRQHLRAIAGRLDAPLVDPRAARKAAPAPGVDAEGDMDSIFGELEAAATVEDKKQAEEEPVPKDFWDDIKERLSWLLVVDIFTTIALAIWLVIGAILRYGFQYYVVLDLFVACWDPYFQTILGVFFAARLFGIGVQSLMEALRNDEEEIPPGGIKNDRFLP